MEAILDSIDSELLTAVTGAGPTLGDREAPAENPKGSQTTVPNSSYWGGIDAGMERMPENPGMDMGMSRQPFSGSPASSLDI